MVDLDFAVEGASVATHAVAPLLLLALRITNRTPQIPIRNVLLRCQVRIEPTRRRYEADEQERLSDLFGIPARWGETLRSFLWTHTNTLVPGFETEGLTELPLPCSFDFNIAATKYFHGLESGEVPLALLFSGSVFYADAEDRLQIDQLSWTKEAAFRLPVALWREMMQHYYPDGMWLCLAHDVFDRLYHFKRAQGFATWEQTLDALLETEGGR